MEKLPHTYFSTPLSGSDSLVKQRIQNLMEGPKKRPPAALLALAVLIIALCGNLVSCQPVQTAEPPASSQSAESAGSSSGTAEGGLAGHNGELLVRGTLSDDLTAVIGENLEWVSRAEAPTEEEDEEGQEQTYPLAKDAQLLYYLEYPSEQTCALNPAVIESSIRQSLSGREMELTLDGAGEVTRLVLRGGVSLDLSAAGLDFTGFTGTVYAPGMGVMLDEQRRVHPVTGAGRGGAVTFDPCTELSFDEDDAQYTLPLAEDADIPEDLRSVLSPLSSAAKPALCALELVDGQVTAIREDLYFAGWIDSYNNQVEIDGSGLTASVADRNGLAYYRFSNAEYGVDVYVDPQEYESEAEDGSTCYRAAVEYRGRSLEFTMPVHPIAPLLAHVFGECAMTLADLTGDGAPELIYVAGYHGSGVGSDECQVFDLAAMEPLAVNIDFSGLERDIRAEITDRKVSGENMVYTWRLTGPGGLTAKTSLELPVEYADGFSGKVTFDGCYSVGVNGDRDGLVLRCAVIPEETPMMWLEELAVPFVLDPAARTFSPGTNYQIIKTGG